MRTLFIPIGTPVFMAPEVLDPGKRPEAMGIEAMKKVDTWSLGMSNSDIHGGSKC